MGRKPSESRVIPAMPDLETLAYPPTYHRAVVVEAEAEEAGAVEVSQ